jgi:hypothetical protein
MLQQLLQRDFWRSINSLNDSLDGAESLAEILRIYVTSNGAWTRHMNTCSSVAALLRR